MKLASLTVSEAPSFTKKTPPKPAPPPEPSDPTVLKFVNVAPAASTVVVPESSYPLRPPPSAGTAKSAAGGRAVPFESTLTKSALLCDIAVEDIKNNVSDVVIVNAEKRLAMRTVEFDILIYLSIGLVSAWISDGEHKTSKIDTKIEIRQP
jgi:hypothetical protein